MLDVKAMLNSTGIKNKENHYLSPPPYPYILFLIHVHIRGADNYNCICERSVTFELYSDKIDEVSESKIEAALAEKGIEYEKSRTWLEKEKFYQTTYDFDLIEKM